MRILLLGEYSNVHATLAAGLRAMGHEVVVASNGDYWKSYPRDVDLRRHQGLFGGARLLLKLLLLLPRWRGYDVVQIINPLFVDLKAERHFFLFRYLRRHNKKVVLGAFGMDYYWVHENLTRLPLRYSDFNIGHIRRSDPAAEEYIAEWIGTVKERLTRLCATAADAIVTGLYEYDVCYRPLFPSKTTYIPLPIEAYEGQIKPLGEKIVVFIGISRHRSAYKGTDIMLRAAEDLLRVHGDIMTLRVVEGLPFAEYCSALAEADILLDQLYSYTPAMNALYAMSRGIVCIGGGEEETYDILGERTLRPVVNVTPSYESVYHALESLLLHREVIERLKAESVAFVARHHSHLLVAQKYIDLYLR